MGQADQTVRVVNVARLKKKVGLALYAAREARKQFDALYSGVAQQSAGTDPVYFEPREKPNNKWSLSKRGRLITWKSEQLIGPDTKVLAIGSCFAVEVRKALKAAGIEVFPGYQNITFDQKMQKIGNLPARDNVNHYDTFNIRQEFERAFEETSADDSEFYIANQRGKDWAGWYTDPSRPGVHARTIEGIRDASRKIDDCFRSAVEAADVYIITLGLIEAWRDNKTGRFVWGWPVNHQHPEPGRIVPHLSTFTENYSNVRVIVDGLLSRYPHKKIVLTVSPVALDRTFTSNDIVTANLESKSLLRTVAGQIVRDCPQVVYWPSFEMASRSDVYEADGRHVTDSFVEFVVSNFLKSAARH